MPDFRRGAPVRAEDLNRTLRAAQTARLAGAAYLSQDNGDALVARDPRRISRRLAGRAVFVQGMQWRITARKDEDGPIVVAVGPGIVAWGAGVNYAHSGDPELGTIQAGSSARVVWVTSAAPLPLVHDPRWPKGDAPDCGCAECDCPDREGDPDSDGGDSGELLLVPTGWTAPTGATDVREIGAVSVSDSGVVTISQLQRDTIVARAVVGRAPGGEKPDETPPCGHPLNGDAATSGEHPLSRGWRAWDGGRHPLDDPGDGGYTPLCADSSAAS